MSTDKKATVNTKEMLSSLAKQRAKVKFADRTDLKIIKATKHYKVGQLISPHSTFAKVLIDNKIAEKA